MNLICWHFVESRDEDESVWAWKTVGPDGETAQVSQRFSAFGAVMRNAMSCGFSPTGAPWVVVTGQGATYYKRRAGDPVPPSPEELPVQDLLI